MYKPRATRDIYIESFSINSASIEKQLQDRSVSQREIKDIIDAAGKRYRENVDRIVEECDRDMMALENVPSPLKLFVDCLGEVQKSMSLSPPARALLQQYLSAWEDWMV
jgi:chromosome condensin MukBEF complex kleisin-like MukF subunit